MNRATGEGFQKEKKGRKEIKKQGLRSQARRRAVHAPQTVGSGVAKCMAAMNVPAYFGSLDYKYLTYIKNRYTNDYDYVPSL